MSGNAAVLVIGFLITPIIARIYGPSAYGEFAIFSAIASIVQPVSTLQLPAGYVAARDDREFSALIKISISALVAVSIIVLIGVFGYFYLVVNTKISPRLGYALPVYIFLAGLFAIMRGWNIKLEEFKRSAQSKVVATILGKSGTLGYGWFISQNALGIVIGSSLAFAVESVGYVSIRMLKSIKEVVASKLTLSQLQSTLREFSSYPKFVATNALINNLSAQLPFYFFAIWYSTEQVGLFSLALSLILIPVNLVGTSIGAVFLPKISALASENKDRNHVIHKLYNKLFYPGFVGLLLLAGILKYGLPILLGPGWFGAGTLASIISIALVFSIITIPINQVYRFINYESVNFLLTIVFILLKLLGLYIGFLQDDFLLSVLYYFLALILQDSIKILVLFKKIGIRLVPVLRDLLITTVSLFLIFYLSR